MTSRTYVVGERLVVVSPIRGGGVGVHQRRGHPRHGMNQLVLGVEGHLVRLDHRGCRVDDDGDLRAQPVPGPAQPQRSNLEHPVDLTQRGLGLIDQRRVDGIDEPVVHVAGGIFEDK